MSRDWLQQVQMIGDLAAQFGLATSALRYYERRGLLASPARVGGRRAYDTAAVRRLAFIRLGQQAGLSLDEVALMLAGGDGAAWRSAAELRLECIAAELTQLQSAKILLEQALRCPADHPLEECPYAQQKVDQVLQQRGCSSRSTAHADAEADHGSIALGGRQPRVRAPQETAAEHAPSSSLP